MNNWNDRQGREYEGMTAQRRQHRKDRSAPDRTEQIKTSRDENRWKRPEPETAETPREENRWKRPEPETAETPREENRWKRPEPETAETPREENRWKRPEPEAGTPGDGSGPDNLPREAPAENETEEPFRPAEEPRENAAPEIHAEEAFDAMRSAASRVPPEARRMTAAPYGAARPEPKRPGTRPAIAANRPAVRVEKQPEVRDRRPAGMGSSFAGRRSVPEDGIRSGRSAQRPGQRQQIGYAPGRMEEEATRQVPAQEGPAELDYTRDARAYLAKRKPPLGKVMKQQPNPKRPESKLLKVVVCLLIAAGLLLSGWMLYKEIGRPSRVPRVISFDLPEMTEGMTAPVDLTFSAETADDVEMIQLRTDDGWAADTDAHPVSTSVGKMWMLVMHVETGFHGTVTLQVRRSEEEGWIDTKYKAEIHVNNVAATPTPEITPVPPTATPAPAEDGSPAEASIPAEDETPVEEGTPTEDGDPAENGNPAEPPETSAEEEIPPAEDREPEEEYGEPEYENGEEGNGDWDELPGGGQLRTVAPTFTPAPTEPAPTETPPLTAEAAPEANPDLIVSTTIYTGSKKEKAYSRPAKELIHMPAADQYTKLNLGVMTFRGDNFRRNAAVGSLSGIPIALSERWAAEAGSIRGTNQTYYGYGWTGQPAIARWSTQVRTRSNIFDQKKEKKGLKEVIIAGMDGNIRFLDLEDGKTTRNSIKLGYPMRGSPSLDTRGAPFISVGQFARKMKVKTGKIGLRQYNLYQQKETKFLDGLDGQQHRPLNNVGSFETSALVDWTSDTLITLGTNGMLYLEALNSKFDYNMGVYSISPSITVMTSKARGQKNTALMAVESSPAAYDRYVFYADMGGVLRCVDTNTLTPVWAVETGDSVMAAIAMDLTDSRELNLYTANMLNNRKKGDGSIQIRRYNALSGKQAWCTDVGVTKGKKDQDDVGAKASPVIGQHRLASLVYFTVTGLSDAGRQQLGTGPEDKAALIALDKESGRVVWTIGLSSRSESSPVAVYDKDGNGWILQCEQNGKIHLLEGLTGQEIASLQVKGEIEASPAVYANVMVIGTTGRGTSFVYGIELKTQAAEKAESGEENE